MVMLISAIKVPSGITLPRQIFPINQQGSSIGRGEQNDVILPDPNRLVSAQHCLIRFQQGQYFLTDLSTNGTYFNSGASALGKGASVPLAEGDIFSFGAYAFRVSFGQRAEDAGYVHSADEFHHSSTRQATVAIPALSSEQDVRDQSSAGRLRKKLLADMGLGAEHLSQQAIAHALEEYLLQTQLIVSGLMRLLRARASIKNDLRVMVTTVQDDGNNPLKFSGNATEALEKLLVRPKPDDLTTSQAFSDAFGCISDHQVALLSAVKAGYAAMFDSFDPLKIEASLGKGALLQGRNKAKLWDAYCERHAELGAEREGAFQALFGDAFVEEYERQILALEEERKRKAAYSR